MVVACPFVDVVMVIDEEYVVSFEDSDANDLV
jgi:hypothetical protein